MMTWAAAAIRRAPTVIHAAVTPGGPAASAGLQAGDVITKVNGTATPDTATLAAVLAS